MADAKRPATPDARSLGYPAESGSVENTAVWVAAKKAIEAQRPLPLVHDPVISAMVPNRVMESELCLEWQLAEQKRLTMPADPFDKDAGADKQALALLALRCRYIDDELLSILHALRRQLALAALNGSLASANRPPIQVVMLGAGLDTRPWRLPLGQDIRWFEVDLPAMTAYKHVCMERAGMQADWSAAQSSSDKNGKAGYGAATGGSGARLPSDPSLASMVTELKRLMGPGGRRTQAGGQAVPSSSSSSSTAAGGGDGPRFPLHVASWAAVNADLSKPGLRKQLEAAGWDPASTTVWVLEGVLYYLSQQMADVLLKEITSLSKAAGSGAIIVSNCSSTMVLAVELARLTWQQALEAAGCSPEDVNPQWWCQADFPPYNASLAGYPDKVMKDLGWTAAHVVSMAQVEKMYNSQRSTRLVPSSVLESVTKRLSNGAVRPEYQIVTATLGLN